MYAKVLNSSETLLISNLKKNTNKLDKINIKNELIVNREVKKTKKRNLAKLFSKKAKKRFAAKRLKITQQDKHQSLEQLVRKSNKRIDKKSKDNDLQNNSEKKKFIFKKRKPNKRKALLNLNDSFHGTNN